jgi:hypothetical protein
MWGVLYCTFKLDIKNIKDRENEGLWAKPKTKQRSLLGSGPRATIDVLLEAVFYVVRSKATSRDRPSSVQLLQMSTVE